MSNFSNKVHILDELFHQGSDAWAEFKSEHDIPLHLAVVAKLGYVGLSSSGVEVIEKTFDAFLDDVGLHPAAGYYENLQEVFRAASNAEDDIVDDLEVDDFISDEDADYWDEVAWEAMRIVTERRNQDT